MWLVVMLIFINTIVLNVFQPLILSIILIPLPPIDVVLMDKSVLVVLVLILVEIVEMDQLQLLV
jgi:hypothetical protein